MQLDVREAARLLGVGEARIFRWIESGTIPFHLGSGQPRFNRTELLEWATANNFRVVTEAFTPPDRKAPWSLADALERGGIHHDVDGSSHDALVRSLVRLLPIPDANEREFLTGVMLARESLGVTVLDDGIAIPHARRPCVVPGAPFSVTLCFLKPPLIMTGHPPIRVLFCLLSSTIRIHLEALARVAAGLHDAELREALAVQADATIILQHVRRIEAPVAQRASSVPSAEVTLEGE